MIVRLLRSRDTTLLVTVLANHGDVRKGLGLVVPFSHAHKKLIALIAPCILERQVRIRRIVRYVESRTGPVDQVPANKSRADETVLAAFHLGILVQFGHLCARTSVTRGSAYTLVMLRSSSNFVLRRIASPGSAEVTVSILRECLRR